MLAVGAGWLSPSEFWDMHPKEFWWLVEAKNPKAFSDRERTYADAWQDLLDAEEQE